MKSNLLGEFVVVRLRVSLEHGLQNHALLQEVDAEEGGEGIRAIGGLLEDTLGRNVALIGIEGTEDSATLVGLRDQKRVAEDCGARLENAKRMS